VLRGAQKKVQGLRLGRYVRKQHTGEDALAPASWSVIRQCL